MRSIPSEIATCARSRMCSAIGVLRPATTFALTDAVANTKVTGAILTWLRQAETHLSATLTIGVVSAGVVAIEDRRHRHARLHSVDLGIGPSPIR